MITFSHVGDFSKTEKALLNMQKKSNDFILTKYGEAGVAALASATPVNTGLTANSWSYVISNSSGASTITFTNSNVKNGVNIAILLQYGHGTGTGGWVNGYDYINPAIKPVFDKIAEDAWKEVTKS